MRHVAQLLQLGAKGQEKLEKTQILIVGVGALGSTVAELLCRAGVHNLTLCDFDIVDETNLQRQSLYQTADIGRLKVEAAKEHLIAIDPMCLVTTIPAPFSTAINIEQYHLLIDGTDTLHTRLLLNDLARKYNIPLIIGTASGISGMVYVVNGSPCWQCITLGKTASDDCTSGVLGTTTHLTATLQVSAAMRTLTGFATKELIEVDVWNFEMRKIHVRENPRCAACKGVYQYITAPFAVRYCANNSRVIANPNKPRLIDLEKVRGSELVEKDYGTAILIRLGDGTALVHQHGTIEFSGVSEEAAHKYAQKMLENQ